MPSLEHIQRSSHHFLLQSKVSEHYNTMNHLGLERSLMTCPSDQAISLSVVQPSFSFVC